ncbi:unnamed protein product [Prunus brigantina]
MTFSLRVFYLSTVGFSFFKKGQLGKTPRKHLFKTVQPAPKTNPNHSLCSPQIIPFPLQPAFFPLAVLKSFHSQKISMTSKQYTAVGGKRRKHLHLDVPQAFIPELAWSGFSWNNAGLARTLRRYLEKRSTRFSGGVMWKHCPGCGLQPRQAIWKRHMLLDYLAYYVQSVHRL